MRGKRSKQYRKLMQQYALTFGFREPYQVIIDAGMLEAAVVQFKMDLVNGLTRTLHGEVKPMLTQCTIRQLYNLPTVNSSQSQAQSQKLSTPTKPPSKKPDPSTQPPAPTLTNADKTAIITLAKTFEKRRCDHADLDQPLSSHACISSVIDPKSNQTNKHRYVLAVQDDATRSWARDVKGVPSIYVKRSVMIMEPMTEVSQNVREGAEREKLRSGIKRKRGDGADGMNDAPKAKANAGASGEGDGDGDAKAERARKAKGPKGVNPLSVRKPKKRAEDQSSKETAGDADGTARKRRRKHKGTTADEGAETTLGDQVVGGDEDDA